ncbi:MAG: CheR family methyltransferase [bacterium]
MVMEEEAERIVTYLKNKHGFDFSGYRSSLIERRLDRRMKATKSTDFSEYLSYLEDHQDELHNLVDALTIQVSRFFRNSLSFEYMADKILPSMLSEKLLRHDYTLRIWSAGCATGEEPYSIAILINELLLKESVTLSVNIFATDIDQNALEQARKAVYSSESLKEIKFGLLNKYFMKEEALFKLHPEIKQMVHFSFYDMLDKKSRVPPDSVYGHFDLVLCRNLLIYFNPECQNIIFDKLYHSLRQGGYLVLGKAEVPPLQYRKRYHRLCEAGHMYQKE